MPPTRAVFIALDRVQMLSWWVLVPPLTAINGLNLGRSSFPFSMSDCNMVGLVVVADAPQ